MKVKMFGRKSQSRLFIRLNNGSCGGRIDFEKKMKNVVLIKAPFGLSLLALILSACNMPALHSTITPSAFPPSSTASPTHRSPPTPTSTPHPTRTASASPSPTLNIPTGYQPVINPNIPNYVFVIDPLKWVLVLSSDDQYAFIKHRRNDGCLLRLVPPMELPLPLHYYPRIIANRKWWVDEYTASAFYHDGNLFLDLRGFRDSPNCLADQELVLARIMTGGETHGQPTPTFTPTPTARPTLENFSCPGRPVTRLRMGDHVLILAEGIWLRSGPRAQDDTKIALYLKNDPYDIVITGGPSCEAFVYWKVTLSQRVAGGKVISGWLAEGDPKNYFLEPYDVPNFGN